MKVALVIILLLSVTGSYSWLDGSLASCKWFTLSRGFDVQFDRLCRNGTMSWSYPEFPKTAEVTWAPDLDGPFKVCLMPSSSADLLTCERIGSTGQTEQIDLSPLSAKDPKEVCADSVDGKVNLNFVGGPWTYIQFVDFIIKS